MDQGPKSPNNKFVESGRKSQSESRIKILVYSVIKKELYAYIFRKYPRTCPNNQAESTIFFLFAVVFLQPFLFFLSFSLSSLVFSQSFFSVFFSFTFFLPSYYILWLFYHFLHPRVGQMFEVLSFRFSCLFLNLPFLAVRLRVHCSGITSTLMRPEGQLGSI